MLFIIRPDNHVKERIFKHIADLRDDRAYEVTIKPVTKNRTKQQNAYFHKLCHILSDYEGSTIKTIKNRLKDVGGFYDIYTSVGGERKQTLKSSAEMNTAELSELITIAQQACAILDLVYPDPSYFGYKID